MSMCHLRRAVLAIVTVAALSGTAIAADAGAGAIYTKDNYPEALPSRPITLPSGMVELTVPVEINLSTNLVGKPIAVGPSLYYGVNDSFTIGIYHPTGLCLTGTDNGCAKVYNDVGAEVIANLMRGGRSQIALTLAFQAAQLSDPTVLQAIAGLRGKYTFGAFGLQWMAGVLFGITERDAGNKEQLAVALQPQLALSRQFSIYGTIGLAAPFDGFSDLYAIPVGAGLLFTPVRTVDVGAEFTFNNLLGKNSSADFRTGTAFVRFRI